MSAQRAINVRSKVSALQSKLSHAAKQSLDRRFGALYDKIYREDVIAEAWKRVRANKGAPGIDRQDFEYIEDAIGVDEFLAKVREELRSERYRPRPVLRRYIAKPGKPEAKAARKRIRKLNGFTRERLRIFLKRKYSDQSRGTQRVHGNLPVRLGLYQFV